MKLSEVKKTYKKGDRVNLRNIKTKRNKTYTLVKKLGPNKWESDGGKVIYTSDIDT